MSFSDSVKKEGQEAEQAEDEWFIYADLTDVAREPGLHTHLKNKWNEISFSFLFQC